jgi:hypothetical protein
MGSHNTTHSDAGVTPLLLVTFIELAAARLREQQAVKVASPLCCVTQYCRSYTPFAQAEWNRSAAIAASAEESRRQFLRYVFHEVRGCS